MVTHDVDEPIVAREDVPSSDIFRARFGYVDGLRALAILAIVLAEVARHAPHLLADGAASWAALDGIHGLDLFFVISGFALAYPALALMRQDGRSYLDLGRYAVKRVVRILPAYWFALGVTLLVPTLAARYGLAAFAAPVPSIGEAFAQAFLVRNPVANDGFWTLALTVRWYLLFPLLLVLWVRSPRGFALLATALIALDLLTPAHALGVGALVAFMLGIVAADLRAQHHAIARFAFPAMLVAGAVAIAIDPYLASLRGPISQPTVYPFNPLWQIAIFGLVVASGRIRSLENLLSLRLLALAGAASYGISLVAEPVTVFILRQATPTLGLATAAINAYVVAVVAGFVLWQLVDRWFIDADLRYRIVDAVAPFVGRVPGLVRWNRVVLVEPHARAFDEGQMQSPEVEPLSLTFYAPPPRPIAPDLAVVTQRVGSPEELAAEILEAKKRLAEKSVEFFADRSYSREPDEAPGFYERMPRSTQAPRVVSGPQPHRSQTPAEPAPAELAQPKLATPELARADLAAAECAPAEPAAAPREPATPEPPVAEAHPSQRDVAAIRPPAPIETRPSGEAAGPSNGKRLRITLRPERPPMQIRLGPPAPTTLPRRASGNGRPHPTDTTHG